MVTNVKKRQQINFEAPELVERLKNLAVRINIKQSVIARAAIREKLDEIDLRLSNGEEVTVSI